MAVKQIIREAVTRKMQVLEIVMQSEAFSCHC